MHEYERMHSSNPSKCYDWLRSRVVAVIELYRISRNQNNMRNESQRESRPDRVMPTFDKSSGGRLDWTCSRCGASVFGSKSACFKCGTPKFSNSDRPDSRRSDDKRDSQRIAGSDTRPPRQPSTDRPPSTKGGGKSNGAKHFCFDFAKHGQCTRGDKCKYPHIAKCTFFSDPNKTCSKGDTCKFAHLSDSTRTPDRSPSRSYSQDIRNRTPPPRSPRSGGNYDQRSQGSGGKGSQKGSPAKESGGRRDWDDRQQNPQRRSSDAPGPDSNYWSLQSPRQGRSPQRSDRGGQSNSPRYSHGSGRSPPPRYNRRPTPQRPPGAPTSRVGQGPPGG